MIDASDDPDAPGVSDRAQTARIGIRRMIQMAMNAPEEWVLELDYRDARGITLRRTISPIRHASHDRVLALCLCREAPRQFRLDQCSNVRLVPAARVLMPVPMQTVGEK